MEMRYIGELGESVYQNLILRKVYAVIRVTEDEDGVKWALIKNEDGNEVEYNTKYFLTKYGVVTRPFYREHSPDLIEVWEQTEEEAMDRAFTRDVKEILDVKPYDDFRWDDKEKNSYWEMYK